VNDILKQRLVGALILVALGVVFWPIIFVEPEGKKSVEQHIPPPPEVSTADIAGPDAGELRQSPELAVTREGEGEESLPSVVPTQAPVPGEKAAAPAPPTPAAAVVPHDTTTPTSVRTESPQRLAMDSAGVPVAWTLQVATVSSAEKAEELRKQLLAMKQEVYVSTVHSGGKILYRVCIGPKFERAALEKLQAGINSRFGVTSIVARYVP
jgi:DedD protein